MNRYEPEAPRALFATAAFALSAITLGVLVVIPAHFDSGFAPATTLTSAPAAPAAPIEIAISPARIDVIGVPVPDVAWALGNVSRPCKPSA
ncbi:MAG: hypothetical protein IT521_00385 [Burkholderiales bacterium]|nr:hypothetical protein [Burkholderiales bacterium]